MIIVEVFVGFPSFFERFDQQILFLLGTCLQNPARCCWQHQVWMNSTSTSMRPRAFWRYTLGVILNHWRKNTTNLVFVPFLFFVLFTHIFVEDNCISKTRFGMILGAPSNIQ